jgi:hypothetical protein
MLARQRLQSARMLSRAELGQKRTTQAAVSSNRSAEIVRDTAERIVWSGRPGSNRRRPAWEAGILPLNYTRSEASLGADLHTVN